MEPPSSKSRRTLNILVSGSHEDDFVFKVTNYAGSSLNLLQLSHSTTSNSWWHLVPTQHLNYLECTLLGQLLLQTYIVLVSLFMSFPAWTKVNMSLIKNVEAGHRPIIPGTEITSCELSGLVQECWQHDPDCRPSAFSAFEVKMCCDNCTYTVSTKG